jgi:2-oxoglutarate dehydrogenase E2 component (dihydrolipoamide succinyltransferase)
MKEIKVPMLPESVVDATVAKWHKKTGDFVQEGENLVDLETDKIMLEVPAPDSGTLGELLVQEGATVIAEQVLTKLALGEAASATSEVKTAATASESEDAPASAVVSEGVVAPADTSSTASSKVSPAVRRFLDEHQLTADQVEATGKDGRLTMDDVRRFVAQGSVAKGAPAAVAEQGGATRAVVSGGDRAQERVPMSRLRARVAQRLVQAQQTAAMLTTFNEVDMHAVMQLRARYKDRFAQVHDTKLGFMSFFVSACVAALKAFPEVNAAIDGQDIIYHHYFDVGIAVSSPRGLVVPVLRNAQSLAMADIERQIKDYALRARDGKITLEEMMGGTFTITNGGVFGSMLSTPILNPPQSAILGMHNIIERAVVIEGKVEVRPMMYLALSYDHRIVDGSQSVRFLVTIKELLEDPSRLLLAI